MISNTNIYVKSIATEALDAFNAVAKAAESNLNTGYGKDVFATNLNNISGNGSPIATLSKINDAKKKWLNVLRKEPAIARIVARSDDGKTMCLYICRAEQVDIKDSNVTVVSYKAPLGRLASIQAGDDVTIPIPGAKKYFEIVERAILTPQYDGVWDSVRNTVEHETSDVVTVSSFRDLLAEMNIAPDSEDILSMILGLEDTTSVVTAGRQRQLIEQMELRDQPVLDRYQDEIFRMSLDSQLLLAGPPGTGKTTTLIRRLGQKLNRAFLLGDETLLIENQTGIGVLPHEQSWIMFSPTHLLKLYVREAFNREEIPASEDKIRTWTDMRRYLARDVCMILKSGKGGLFTLVDDTPNLQLSTVYETIKWFEDFEDYFLTDIYKKLISSLKWLEKNDHEKIHAVITKVKGILKTGNKISGSKLKKASVTMLLELLRLESEISAVAKIFREEFSETVKSSANIILRTNRNFFQELLVFLDSLQDESAEDEDELDEDEEEIDDVDEPSGPVSSSKIRMAYREYSAAIRVIAKARFANRQLKPTTKASKILSWLGDRIPSENELASAGKLLTMLSELRVLGNPVKLYVGKIPARYQAFRKTRYKEGTWYSSGESFEAMSRKKQVNGLETDLMLLLMLRHATALLERVRLYDIESNAKLSLLNTIRREYRNQVLVDEATDFSPVQLACMFTLSNPKIHSFFACGDIYQRVTPWGIKSDAQLSWVSKNLEIRPMNIAYRQSHILTNLASKIAQLDGQKMKKVDLPNITGAEGVKPVLVENLSGRNLAEWLADRIYEIEKSISKLPSIAVFVDGESEVMPLADLLKDVSKSRNIQVIGCQGGRDIGQDANVRVFDVRHIKGLEFEAVFFVNIDRLAAKSPDLFNKYLYVGTTRAATYLGFTCEESLPKSMKNINNEFVSSWS